MPTRWTVIASIVAVASGLGCGAGGPEFQTAPAPAPAVAEHSAPRSGAHPRAILPDGFTVKLDLAISPEEVAQGLMYRPSLADDRGMLFLFEEERMPSFWMKNTLVALDIVFLDGQGVVVDVAHEAQPCTVEPCPQYIAKKASLAVLELAAGSAAEHGIVDGAQITFDEVSGYPR